MSLSSVSNLGTPPVGVAAAASPVSGPRQSLSVTSLLGLSTDEIARQMRSGKSLDDIARSKNVSHADLVAAIKAGGPRELRTRPRTDQVADRPPAPPAEKVASADLPARGAHGDAFGRLTRSMTRSVDDEGESSKARGLHAPEQKNPLGSTASQRSRDVDVAHPQVGVGLHDLVKRAGFDPTTLGGGMPKGLIIDTTA